MYTVGAYIYIIVLNQQSIIRRILETILHMLLQYSVSFFALIDSFSRHSTFSLDFN